MTGVRSNLDDPPCPECESPFAVIRAGQREGGDWFCFRCERTFDPSPEYRAARDRR